MVSGQKMIYDFERKKCAGSVCPPGISETLSFRPDALRIVRSKQPFFATPNYKGRTGRVVGSLEWQYIHQMTTLVGITAANMHCIFQEYIIWTHINENGNAHNICTQVLRAASSASKLNPLLLCNHCRCRNYLLCIVRSLVLLLDVLSKQVLRTIFAHKCCVRHPVQAS